MATVDTLLGTDENGVPNWKKAMAMLPPGPSAAAPTFGDSGPARRAGGGAMNDIFMSRGGAVPTPPAVAGTPPFLPEGQAPTVTPASSGGAQPTGHTDEGGVWHPDLQKRGTSQTPVMTPVSTGGSTPVSSNPQNPETPHSSTLDQIMATDRAAIETARTAMGNLPNAPPRANLWNDPNHGKLRTLLNIFAGGVEGGVTGSVKEGMRVQEPMLQQPQEEANKTWTAQHATAQRAYEDAIQNFNVDLAATKAKAEEGDRAAAAHLRDLEGQKITDELAGGPQKRAQDLQTQQRQKEADDLAKSGASPEQVARYRATGQVADTTPKTDAELAIAAHRVGPDGKPTVEAQQAAAAFKDLQKQRLDQIHATKNPNEQAILLKDLQTNYVTMRGQLERELTSIEGNVMARNDPAAQQQVQAIKKSMGGLDKDISTVNDEIKKRIGGPLAAAPAGGGGEIKAFKGAQNFTVAAEGKPSVQKSLTYDQVQKLQAAGVQLSPATAVK